METPNILSGFTDYQLQKELEQRAREADKEAEKKKIKKEIEQWHNRPKCALIGRAYGRSNNTKKVSLAHIFIPGNMGHEYYVTKDVCSTTETFFHNVWRYQVEQEFEKKLQQLVDEFIEKLCVDPVIVVSLIGLSRPYNTEFPELQEEWHRAAMERLCEFSLEELKKALEDVTSRWATSHGQEKLLKDAIAIKT